MTKLCPRGKAAAKRKFAVYPSAYANAYASKICAGKIKEKIKCTTCKKHWYIAAIVALLLWCWIF